MFSGPGSSVGIATELPGWTVWGLNPSGRRHFPPVQTGPGAHSGSCTMGTGSFPGVKSSRGVSRMVSFPPISPPRPYTPPSPHPYAPHAQPISFFCILSPAQHWVSSTNHIAPRYAVSSIPPLPPHSSVHTFSSTPCSVLKHPLVRQLLTLSSSRS